MRTILYLVALSFLLQGCTQSVGTLEKREDRDPLVQRARAKAKAGEIQPAADLYYKALERRPQMARPHLELGLLYDKQAEDYLRAIYHYQRYIEMRPDAQKREMIEELIRYAKISYASTLPDQSSEAVEAIADLRAEIGRLKNELGDVAGRAPLRTPQAGAEVAASQPSKPAVAPPAAQPVAPRPAPAQSAMETYKVQRGDTLSRIASKMYKDPQKWRVIYDANRNILSSPESLKMNQTLVIPSI